MDSHNGWVSNGKRTKFQTPVFRSCLWGFSVFARSSRARPPWRPLSLSSGCGAPHPLLLCYFCAHAYHFLFVSSIICDVIIFFCFSSLLLMLFHSFLIPLFFFPPLRHTRAHTHTHTHTHTHILQSVVQKLQEEKRCFAFSNFSARLAGW